jgi:hypothetical protein
MPASPSAIPQLLQQHRVSVYIMPAGVSTKFSMRRRAAAAHTIVVRAYFFTQAYACSFLKPFRHNFAENDPQDLKIV